MGFAHADTPKKVRVQTICDYLEEKGETGFHAQVFRDLNVGKSSGWRILGEPRAHNGRTFHSTFPDTRGRKRKLSSDDVDVIEAFLETNGFDGRTIPWAGLPAAVGLDIECSSETVRRRLKERGFRMCIACEKKWISPHAKARREEYARTMLEKYPEPEDWYNVRFSDECHYGFGPSGKVYIIRRSWERECPECLIEKEEPAEADLRRLHCWAAIGYDFKSDLVWYDVPSNNNGKMSLKVYRDQILEPVVGQWLREGHSFVLEEDNDSGHGGGGPKKNRLDHYFNSSHSPDFVPIEKAWAYTKREVRKRQCWDDETVKGLAEEGWAKLSQKRINKWVDQIPQILEDCIELEGALTGH